MLKINLLPESARPARLSPIEQLHRMPVVWLAAALMVAAGLSLAARVGLGRRALAELNAKIQVLQPKKLEVDQIQRILHRLHAQEAAFHGLKKGQGLWSKRLNALSNVTPEGVWFTELTLTPTRGLTIQGSALEQDGSEMVSVGRLVQDLKADADVASAVKDIQIESIKRVQEGDIEVVQFTLACALREPSAAAGSGP